MSKKEKLGNWFLLILAALLICSQAFNLDNSVSSGWLKTGFLLLHNAVLLIVPLAFGLISGSKPLKISLAIKGWLLSVAALICCSLFFFLVSPQDFDAWLIFGAVLPVLTSTSVLLAGILFAIIAQPYLFRLQSKLTVKQNLFLLSLSSLLFFILSAGSTSGQTYSLFGLFLILPFAWGMFLHKVKIKHEQAWGEVNPQSWTKQVQVWRFLFCLNFLMSRN
jgi:hypothetical protein